jgi:hypothetical protein
VARSTGRAWSGEEHWGVVEDLEHRRVVPGFSGQAVRRSQMWGIGTRFMSVTALGPYMETNVGSTDRLARIVLGAILGTLSLAILGNAISLPTVLSPILGALSLVMLITAATSKCGLYSLVGMNTAN